MTSIEASALYQSIQAQPAAVGEILGRTGEQTAAAAELLLDGDRVFLVGTGTSYHAARVGEYLLRAAGLDAWAVAAFDFALYPGPLTERDAVIVISHRGVKRYSQDALARALAAGASVIGITGYGSPMSGADVVIHTVPQERSATHTISYLGALTVLAATAAVVEARSDRDMGLAASVPLLPDLVGTMLAAEPAMRALATEIDPARRMAFAGGGPNEATATEGALKVKEAAYMTAEGDGVEQFLHGPIVGTHAGDLFVLCGVEGPSATRLRETARGAREIGLRVVAVGIDLEGAAPVIPMPPVPEALSPALTVVPLQLLACFLAAERGTNPDSFRQEVEAYKRASSHYSL